MRIATGAVESPAFPVEALCHTYSVVMFCDSRHERHCW
jgi:hypothetical protein